MIVWVEGKNTSLSPHESSYARENQPHNNKDNHANQLSNLNDVLEENKRKNIADLNTQIRAYWAKHNDLKIKNSQHAFTNDRSTVSALACITQNWHNKTDNSRDGRMGVHVLFIDFRKAFDLVDHGILLRKLAEMNVSKCFWLWTRNFLEGRSQQVNLGGALSSTMPCPLGVLRDLSNHQHCSMST